MASSWRTKLLWILVVGAGFTLIIAGFYAEENTRGVHAWAQCQRDLAARGESIAWTNFLPTPVPDDQNFYKAPMMTEWFGPSWHDSAKDWIRLLRGNVVGTYTNITAENASSFLALVAPFETNFSLICEAVKRPSVRLPGDYTTSNNLPAPAFSCFHVISITLAHRAECHLLEGNSTRAFDDLTLLYDLNRVLVKTSKPGLFINVAIYRLNLRAYAWVIARGIQTHAWTEPQLAVMQKQMADTDLLPIAADSMRAERAQLCREVETLPPSELIGSQPSDFWWFIPSGWLRENEALCASFDQEIIDCYDLTNHTIAVGRTKALDSKATSMAGRSSLRDHFAITIINMYPRITEENAFFQTWIDQAQIACALERYRLAHGQYPADLASLTPQYLDKIPHDIINGKPMIYARQDEQHFLLYSTGWNEVDDGGFIYHQDDGRENDGAGDWVWHYPAN